MYVSGPKLNRHNNTLKFIMPTKKYLLKKNSVYLILFNVDELLHLNKDMLIM
jgi:hypothetical protein